MKNKVSLGSDQQTTKNIPSLRQKSSFLFYLILNKNVKIICFMTYSVEFSNDFILVFKEMHISNRSGEKNKRLKFGYYGGALC